MDSGNRRHTIKEDLAGWRRKNSMVLSEKHHHYLSFYYMHKWLERVAVKSASGRLLDFGCGGQPYRSLFEPQVEQYIGADVSAAAGVQLDGWLVPGEPAPFEDNSFDTVLSTQVLEHVPDPRFYIFEASRMLKDGGQLILTAPMQWRHHEVPYDYYRYTRFGLEQLIKDNGFEVSSIEAAGGVYALLGQIFLNHRIEINKNSAWVNKWVNRLAIRLDAKYDDREDTLNWLLIAKKIDVGS